ncbi:uncharacterized protein LOC134282897 isoform X2 [Saccostrea cucullata]|uniref:uncharacterized protein LOC134282897 isoform X2 n=1 Tax=Saccostrea cuccullata TaxID=36930 RepID=UPI002ED0AB78
MSAIPLEKPVELRECLKNGTLSLRDLDNKKRRSSKGRRRRSKTKTGRTEEAADGGETRAKAAEDPGHGKKASKITKSSKTKKIPKGNDSHVEMSIQSKESDEEIVRSLLDEAFDTVTSHCIDIEYGVAYEQAHELADAFLAAFDERVVLKRKYYMEQRRETQELLYRTAEENVNDLIIRATTQCSPSQEKEQHAIVSTVNFQRSANLAERMRVRVEQINAEKLAMQQIMVNASSEVVKDLFSCAANNASKTKTWRTEEKSEDRTPKTEAVKDPRNTMNVPKIVKSSETKPVPKERDVKLDELITKHKKSEEIVRSILDDVLDTVTRQCIANEQSVENERTLMLVLDCVAAFEEMNQFTKKLYVDERRETQELLYREAKENVKNLLRSTDFNARMRAQVKQINAQKLARKQIVYQAASETVQDLFSCAANNASIQNVQETEVTIDEETDCELPVRGWRRFLCCGQTNKPKQKKKRTRLLAGLRRFFGRY